VPRANEVPADDGVAAIEQDACDAFLIRGEPCGGCDCALARRRRPVPGFPSVGTGYETGASLEHADLAGTEIEGRERLAGLFLPPVSFAIKS